MCLAVPGKILNMEGDDALTRRGKVDFGGVTRTVSLACVPEARVGDYVIVHVGVALAVLDEAEARKTRDELAELERAAAAGGP